MSDTAPAYMAALAAEAPAAPEDKLAQLRALAAQLRDGELEQSNLEGRLEETKAALHKLRHVALPDLMDDVGVDKVGLPASGNLPAADAVMKPYYRASIAAEWPDERRAAAFDILIAEDAEDLIKYSVTVEFGRGEEEQAHQLMELLKGEGFEPRTKLSVSWNTLTAWIRERFENERPLAPDTLEKLGGFVGRIVTLKARKEK